MMFFSIFDLKLLLVIIRRNIVARQIDFYKSYRFPNCAMQFKG